MKASTLAVQAAAAALLAIAAGAQAAPVYAIQAVDGAAAALGIGGNYSASGLAGVARGESAIYAVPVGLTDERQYFYVTPEDGAITVQVGASSFAFLWGSPDRGNLVTYHTSLGDFSFGGGNLWHDFGIAPNGDRSISTVLNASLADQGGLIDSVTFTSRDWSFEYAVLDAGTVAEPGALALVLTALGAAAWTGRRRIASLRSVGPKQSPRLALA